MILSYMYHVCSVTTIRVPCCVELDTWHVVSAGRHASQGYLQLDDTLVKGKSGGRHKRLFERCTVVSGEGLLTLDVAPVVWLGGLPDMSELAGAQGEAVTLARYKGCIRRVKRLRSVSHIQLELSTNLREVSQ